MTMRGVGDVCRPAVMVGIGALLVFSGLLGCQGAYPDGKAASCEYSVVDFGAVSDGREMASAAIQRAIDACHAGGGGTVKVPPGTYLCGALTLRSGVNLCLERGATILGSPKASDYQASLMALISAIDQDGVSITGGGVIDGNGLAPDFQIGENDPGCFRRPFVLRFNSCRNVVVEGVTLRNAGAWVQHYKGCDGVRVDGVTVYSHGNLNNDGIDIESRNVTVSNCVIDSDDDAICLKSGDRAASCENVVISNCVVASNCNAIKMGTASLGGFKNIAISNCVVRACKEQSRRKWRKAISGLALEVVDGGTMDGVSISNIIMTDVQTPIFIRLGDRIPPLGALRNVSICGIVAKGDSLVASSITGVPGGRVSGVKLSDITLSCPGGGTDGHRDLPVPEGIEKYPEAWMFGKSLPAYGLYVRHVDDITMDNIRFTLMDKERRPAVVCDDVRRLRMTGVEADGIGPCLLKLSGVTNALISSSFLFSAGGCPIVQKDSVAVSIWPDYGK